MASTFNDPSRSPGRVRLQQLAVVSHLRSSFQHKLPEPLHRAVADCLSSSSSTSPSSYSSVSALLGHHHGTLSVLASEASRTLRDYLAAPSTTDVAYCVILDHTLAERDRREVNEIALYEAVVALEVVELHWWLLGWRIVRRKIRILFQTSIVQIFRIPITSHQVIIQLRHMRVSHSHSTMRGGSNKMYGGCRIRRKAWARDQNTIDFKQAEPDSTHEDEHDHHNMIEKKGNNASLDEVDNVMVQEPTTEEAPSKLATEYSKATTKLDKVVTGAHVTGASRIIGVDLSRKRFETGYPFGCGVMAGGCSKKCKPYQI